MAGAARIHHRDHHIHHGQQGPVGVAIDDDLSVGEGSVELSPLSGVACLTKDLRQHLGNLAARTDVHITKSDSDQDRPN
jgi:hypothetical protein